MPYYFRIPADAEYLQALGRATYNFAYLEWGVIWTIVKLSKDGFGSVPQGKSSGYVATAFARAIADTSPPLADNLRRRLVKSEQRFRKLIGTRNKLLHAHPYTASDGTQQLGAGGGLEWPVDDVYEAARLFEEAAIEVNDIFHGDLREVRP